MGDTDMGVRKSTAVFFFISAKVGIIFCAEKPFGKLNVEFYAPRSRKWRCGFVAR
jgi:hypothetical protein